MDACPSCRAPSYTPIPSALRIRRGGSEGFPEPSAIPEPLEKPRQVPLPAPEPASCVPDDFPDDIGVDSSPLAPLLNDHCPARVVVNEADIEEDSVGELQIETDENVPGESAPLAPAYANGDSEFDIRLAWSDSGEGPPPGPDQWHPQEPATQTGSLSDDFGVHLVEPAGPPETKIDHPTTEHYAAPGAAPGSGGHADREEEDWSDIAAAEEVQKTLAEREHPGGPESTVAAGSTPPSADWPAPTSMMTEAANTDSVASDDEIDMKLLQMPGATPSGGGTVPIEQALPWFSPGAVRPPRERARLSLALFGVLVGAGVCFGLWICGLEPPASWRLKRAATAANKASIIDPAEAAKEKLIQKARDADAKDRAEQDSFAQRTARDFTKAVDLAQARRYPAAIETLEKVCAAIEQRQWLNYVWDRIEDDMAQRALLDASYELLASWQLEESLANEGILPQSRDTEAVLGSLLTDNRELRRTLEALNVKLKTAGPGVDSTTLAGKIERLLRATEEAERRAALVPVERERAAQAKKTAEEAFARAAFLDEKLRTTEARLQKTEGKLREIKAEQEAARQVKSARVPPPEKTLILPPLKLATTHDGKVAFEHYEKGLVFYRQSNYADAEKEFLAAVEADDQDARYQYYAGLTRWARGKREEAQAYFRKGARLERDNKPSQVFVKLALERADGEALQEMNRVRQ
jgi:tetratricopeptide (TPR) repeat protein